MSGLENIVRPFAAVQVHPLSLGASAPPANPQVVQCSFGGTGGRTVSWTFNGEGSVVPSDDGRFTETGRNSEKVRVENPNDSQQFVEFCRAKSVTLAPNRTSQPTPQTSTYDTSGGYHDLSGGAGVTARGQANRQYTFKYPTSTTCAPTSGPPTGCA